MIKKMISKALLSVVMDKKARETLEFKKKIREVSETLAAENVAARQAAQGITQRAEQPTPPVQPAPLPQRGIETAAPPPSPPDPVSGMTHEETRQLIIDSLKAAEEELGSRPEMTSERQGLIRQALEIRNSKQHVLSEISDEQRQKLMLLALQSLKSNPASITASSGRKKKNPGQ